MTDTSLALIHGLMESMGFKTALKEFIDEEIRQRVEYLRSFVRENHISRAGQIEGELGLLEELPALLEKYARKFAPNRS